MDNKYPEYAVREDVTNDQLAEMYNRVRIERDNLEKLRKQIGDEIINRLRNDGEIFGHYAVSKRPMYKFDIPLEKARELGATETREEIVTEKLKHLYLAGVKLSGEVTVTYSPIVRNIKEEEK